MKKTRGAAADSQSALGAEREGMAGRGTWSAGRRRGGARVVAGAEAGPEGRAVGRRAPPRAWRRRGGAAAAALTRQCGGRFDLGDPRAEARRTGRNAFLWGQAASPRERVCAREKGAAVSHDAVNIRAYGDLYWDFMMCFRDSGRQGSTLWLLFVRDEQFFQFFFDGLRR